MKTRIIYFLTNIIVLVGCLTLQSCGGSDPSATDKMKTILTSGTWNLQSVTVDGATQTPVYSGLTIKFTDGGFTTTNGRVIWPASGTWQFSDTTGELLTRGDGLVITINEATTNKLVLQFSWNQTTLGPGRVNSVEGVNIFTLGK